MAEVSWVAWWAFKKGGGAAVAVRGVVTHVRGTEWLPPLSNEQLARHMRAEVQVRLEF